MLDNSSNNARIAKNTIFLYFRMILIMVVTLFTSRVILNTLGVEDYGIYNVVGGVVAMFGFLNSSMSATTQRYIAYALGKGEQQNLKKIFSTCVLTHAAIALIVFILIESVGLWFLYNKLVIPESRFTAAFWVFQCSTISMLVSIMSVPFNADIIAHEKMSAFAYISIIEVTLKLLIVYMLSVGNFDKLILYGILLLIVQTSIIMIYQTYCIRHFEEARFKFILEKSLFKEMFAFAGWNIWGNLAAILFNQGLNILLNIYFGPVVNAAKGVANQIDGAVKQFATSFQMALNPQITKTYAVGDYKSMHSLIFRSSKFTFFLMLALSLPVMMETPMILELWLKTVPDWTVSFVRILLGVVVLDAVANPLMTAAAATGNVKVYQSVVGGILLAIVPVSYLVLELGGNPASVFVVHLSLCMTAFIARLFIVRPMIHMSLRSFFSQVVVRCAAVGLFAIIIPILLHVVLKESILNTFITIMVSVISVGITSYAIGLTTNERVFVNQKILAIIQKRNR